MRGKRIDTNQPLLVEQMRKIGMSVYVTSAVGKNFVDAVCGHQGKNYLFEIKDPGKPPSKRKLRPGQEAFFQTWKGSVHKVETIEDVIKIINS